MKMINVITILVTVFIMAVAIPVFAFHSGSQLKCNNCHTMHYSEGGQIPSTANGYPQDADSGGPFEKLLLKANITDLNIFHLVWDLLFHRGTLRLRLWQE